MNRVPCGEGAQESWAGLIDTVAAALAGQLSSGRDGPLRSHSLLAAVAGATPPSLRLQLERSSAEPDVVGGDVEPLIYQNELPVWLLARGIVEVGAQAVAAWRKGLADDLTADNPAADDAGLDTRMIAIVAISALSTLRLELTDEDAVLAKVRHRIAAFSTSTWAEALGSLTNRTRELHDLLWIARNKRSHQWQHVTLEDRVLAEAVAAAVVGGAASASGVPPAQWLFPFHLFCRLAVSAAEDALAAIERWLGADFLPAPHTAERAASLAVLATDEAASLWQGCACKSGTDVEDLAFTPRGRCRQPDHDLRSWQPGEIRPGSRRGSHFASTLWGWLRRWLGGADAGRATDGGHPSRSRLHTNDVAGSVLARRWLSAGRGSGGPVLLYDRILPEFCLECKSKVQLARHAPGAGHAHVERVCCGKPQRVYQSDFSERNSRRMLRPKLGIVVIWQSEVAGSAGYCSTAPLGPLWLCRTSGRYSRSQQYCPACGPDPGPGHEPVPHGWVLLPREQAWHDLVGTAGRGGSADGPASGATVSESDLRYLEEVFAELQPGTQPTFATPADVWAAARGWSIEEMERFRDLAGQRGLELLLRCKQIAEGTGQDPDGASG